MSLLAVLLTAGIVFLQQCKKQPPRGAKLTKKSQLSNPLPQQPVLQLERYSSSFNEGFSAADTQAENELAKSIRQCAVDILKAVLPEKAAVLAPLEVELLAEQTALVTCRAVIFGNANQEEQQLTCRVRVSYLPSGNCEAEYPEFFKLK